MERFKELSLERQSEIERILFNALVEVEKFNQPGARVNKPKELRKKNTGRPRKDLGQGVAY